MPSFARLSLSWMPLTVTLMVLVTRLVSSPAETVIVAPSPGAWGMIVALRPFSSSSTCTMSCLSEDQETWRPWVALLWGSRTALSWMPSRSPLVTGASSFRV